jgi:perosamine synthetase
MKVRLFQPSVGLEELAAIQEVFHSAWIGLGPKVTEFENQWRAFVGSKHAIGMNSATAALHLALAVYQFTKGKKVLVPAITFVSTATAALYCGLEPVFVDVREDTLGMDLNDLERKIDKDCVAVMPVHLCGHPVAMDKLIDIASKNKLKVIEDCAHSAGGFYKGKVLGTWGDIGCYSFEEKKCMTTGDGGMFCTDDDDLVAPVRAMRWVGIDKDTWKRNAGYTRDGIDDRHWYYEIALLGYKYNMNDLAAAIGLAQLKKLPTMNDKRTNVIARYLEGIKSLRYVKPLIPYALNEGPVYHIFGVRTDANRRNDLMRFLKQHEIATGLHYTPLTLHPLFHSHKEAVPTALSVYDQIMTLPLHAKLTDQEVEYVIEVLSEWDSKQCD